MAAQASTKRKVALITGITGQDGSYLADLLLQKGYFVHGITRRSSLFNTKRIDHLYTNPSLKLHYGDMTDGASLTKIVTQSQPDEVYNLAAQSHVQVSFEMPQYTAEADAVGTLNLLEALRTAGLINTCRFYQASTSELYGKVQEIPQKETTPFYPRSPYAVAKLYAYWIVVNYRESYNAFAVNGILFNHESPRRGPTFVTQKIVRAAVRIFKGLQKELVLGNLDALRDWGHAQDYVEGMYLMLQTDKPEDFVLATGEQHSVREFCEITFRLCGMELDWHGSAENEVAVVRGSNPPRQVIRVSKDYYRPAEVETLLGDPTKAKTVLGWQPRHSFMQLVECMVEAEKVAIDTREDTWA